MATLRGVGRGLLFLLCLCLWGLGVSLLCLLPWTWFRFFGNVYEKIDYRGDSNATLISTLELCRRKDGPLQKFWCFEIESGWLLFRGTLVLVFSLYWLTYIRLPRKTVVGIVTLQLFVYACLQSFLKLGPTAKHDSLYRILLPFVSVIPSVILCVILGTKFAKFAFQWMILASMGNLLIMFYDWLEEHVDPLVMLVVLIPLLRLFTLGMSRSIARPMFLKPEIFGPGIQVRREWAWFVVVFVQAQFAFISRTLVVNLGNWTDYGLFMAANTISELLSRYTPYLQDKFIGVWIKKTRKGKLFRQGSVIAPVTGERVASTLDEYDKLEAAKRQWYAYVVLGDMVAEYISLFTNLGLLLLFHDSILMLPIPVFASQPHPFTEPMPINTWIIQTVVQVVCELGVDALCFSVEHLKLEFPLQEAWYSKSFAWKLSIFTLATFSASAYCIRFLLRERNERWCESPDLCNSCTPSAGTLYAQFCQEKLLNHFSP